MFVLRNSTSFSDAGLDALVDLAEDMRELRFSAGDTLWTVGDAAPFSVLVLEGSIACHPPDLPPFELGHGFYVGGLESTANEPRWYTARAAGDVRALELDTAAFIDVLEDHPEFAMAMMRSLAGGIAAFRDRMRERASRPPPRTRALPEPGEQGDEAVVAGVEQDGGEEAAGAEPRPAEDEPEQSG